MVDSATLSTMIMPVAAESPPMKASNARNAAPSFIGYRENECVRIHVAARKTQDACERDWQDKNVNEKKIEGETATSPP